MKAKKSRHRQKECQRQIVGILQQVSRTLTGRELEPAIAWKITRAASGKHGGMLALPEAMYNSRGARRGERGPLTHTRIRREIRFR